MHYKVAALLSAATFSLCAFARRPPPPPPPSQSGVNPIPLDKRGFVNGWCGVHVIQYQRNEGPVGTDGHNYDYRVDMNFYDAVQDPKGDISQLSLPSGDWTDIPSQLPDRFQVLVGGADGQPVRFQYNGQTWTSAYGQCSVGDYDSGSRSMDCGFTC